MDEILCDAYAAQIVGGGLEDEDFFRSLFSAFRTTIVEARERIDQVEIAFCNQLFPSFRRELAKSRRAVKRLQNEHKAATDAWDEERKSLLQEIDLARSQLRETQRGSVVQQVKGLSGDAEQQEQKALVEKEAERSPVPDHNALEETVEEEEHQTSEPHVSEVTCSKPAFEVVVSSQERAKRCMRTVVPRKENLYPESDEPENRRLREQIHRLRQQLVNLRRKYTGSRNQYCALQQRFCGKAPFTFAADSSSPVDNSHTSRKPPKETLPADPLRNGLDVAQECGSNAAKRKRMSGISPANDASDQGGVILPEEEATVLEQRPSLAVGSHSSARIVSGSSSKELLQPVAAKSGKPEIVHISTEVCKGRPDCRSTTTENGRSECEEELVKKPEQVSMRYKNSATSRPPSAQAVGFPQQSSTSNPRQQATTGVLSDKINVSVVTPGRLKLVRTNLQQERGYKYIEPVRKKSEREALQSTDCRQCKKFYDAVLAKDANGVVESRCKHHDASRHRYKFAPPATPEGFWNIGFDSDL
ncbi:unnamed protein product [Sphagnum jensenii]|uniref:DNA endonuclease activator Ctp1 C-terminal domain-containing protein n=1 Tax=Sphagnum jensenii TaxID=128206 RepID=A0ABP0VZ86_9BRYO